MININHILFIQMLNFLFVLFVLNIILYRPLLSKIRERFKTIEDMKEKAEKLKQEAKENEQVYKVRLEEAEQKAKENYAKIVNDALKEKEQRISEHHKKAIEEINKFEEEIKKQVELEINSSKDYSFEIANEIYKHIVE